MKIVHVVGTRPNFMKMAPLIRALDGRAEQLLVHTGQHYDKALSDAFFEDLDLPYPDYFLGVGSGSHGMQTAAVISGLEPILLAERPDALVVPGDVNSTMAAAITGVKLEIPVVHLEAGLRSHDRTMPEEHNRVVADHVAELLLTPSRDADENLAAEGIPRERIAFVGNAMIDSLLEHLPRARELDTGPGGHLLVTLHRPALVDDADQLGAVLAALERIAASRPVLFPVHPRTAKMIETLSFKPDRVQLLEPQGYLRFLALEARASAVLTDSGGVQEETSVLGVPCFTMRANTERPVTVSEGTNRVIGLGAGALDALQAELEARSPAEPASIEGWDGKAGPRAAEAILERYS